MTLDEFVTTYRGEVVRGGQCGELVRQYWIDVDKTNPPSYPSSKDYWFNPVPGYVKVSTPQPGDIAIYNGHGEYTDGHSAIYYDGRVFEQNADPDGSPAHLYNRANTYLLGYLRKEEDMINDFNDGDARNLYFAMNQKEPTDAEKAAFVEWAKNNKNQLLYETIIRRFNDLNQQLADAAKPSNSAAQQKLDQIKQIIS